MSNLISVHGGQRTPVPTITTTHYGRERITVGDHALVIVPRDRTERHVWKPTRLFGAIDTLGGELNALLDVNTDRPVSGPGRDDFANDTERDAHMREYRSLKRRLTAHVRERSAEILAGFSTVVSDLGESEISMKFSTHAGCTVCPCSPGFILGSTVTYNGTPVDLWLEPVDRD